MKITFVGHICVDRNVVKGEEQVHYGGGVVHGAVTALRLGAEVTVLTKCAQADATHYGFLSELGAELRVIPSPASTSIRNLYPTDNPDDRQSSLLSRAAPFLASDLDDLEVEVLHVNPLSAGELGDELLPLLRARVATLVADAQGFVRCADGGGRLVHRDWAGKERFLPLLDLFKVDHSEARVLTGREEPAVAARRLVELGARTVLLTHKNGVVAAEAAGTAEAAFGAYSMEGRTGRGDTCTAAFLVARQRGASLDEAARFAAQLTTRKMQYAGPYRGEGGETG